MYQYTLIPKYFIPIVNLKYNSKSWSQFQKLLIFQFHKNLIPQTPKILKQNYKKLINK